MAKKRVESSEPHKKRGKSDEDKKYDEEHDLSTVQCKLNSIVRERFKDEFVPLLDSVAFNMSRIVFEAWMLAELHVMRMLDENKELEEISQTFFKSCCVLVSKTKRGGGSDELRTSMEIYRSLRPEGWIVPENESMSQLMSLCAKEMVVAFNNHINVNLVSRLKRYVRVKHRLSSVDAGRFIRSTFNDPDNMLTDDQKEFRVWFGRNPYFEVKKQEDINHVLRKLHDIQRFYDTLNPRTKGLKTFSLLPKKAGFVTAFIQIDKDALIEILKLLSVNTQEEIIRTLISQAEDGSEIYSLLKSRLESGHCFSREISADVNISRALWHVLFDLSQFETSNRRLKYRISTNGCSVSVFLQKEKESSRVHLVDGKDKGFDKMPSSFDHFQHFVGVDPGKNYVMSAFSGEEINGKSRCVQVSNKQIRHDSKMDEHQEWEKSMRKNNKEYMNAINSLPSLKTGSLVDLQYRIHETLVASVFLFGFCHRKAFRQRRFKASVYSKKGMAGAVNKILDGKDPSRTLVGHGDWSNPKGMKGKEPVPCKRMRQALRKAGAIVVEINEFRTSLVCSGCCTSKTKNVWYEKGDRSVKCHETIRCRNSECGVYWQRDVNGSRNIYSLLMAKVKGGERPSALSRGVHFTTSGQLLGQHAGM